MDQLSRNIQSLEREINISSANPWKVIIITLLVVGILGAACIAWFQPTGLKDEEDNLSMTKSVQFFIAILVFAVSCLWIFWNLFMFI